MRYLKRSLMALSVGLNIAFVLFWGMQFFSGPDTAPSSSLGPQVSKSMAGRYGHIDMTEGQRRELEPYLQGFMVKSNNIRTETMDLRKRMLDMLDQPEVDETAIRDIQQKILRNQAKMKDEVVGLLLKEKSVLPPQTFHRLIMDIKSFKGGSYANGTNGCFSGAFQNQSGSGG